MSKKLRQLGRRSWRSFVCAAPERGWLLVAAWLVALLLISNLLLPYLRAADLSVYLLQPLLWLSLAALVLWLWREAGNGVVPVAGWLVAGAVLVAVCQIILTGMAGVLTGFGRSPYSHRFPYVIFNLWFVAAHLAGLELARWYLVATLHGRRRWLGIGAAWLLLWLAATPLASVSQLSDSASAFRFAGKTLLPAASENMLATYLVMVGGPWASLAYRCILQVFEWLAPILPNLKWPLAAFLGVIVPVLGLVIIHDLIEPRLARKEDAPAKQESWGMGWVMVAVFAVFLFWFNTGLFGIRPALTSGISMEPTLRVGDIAIIREVSPADIKINDIIRYKSGNASILHRVVDIYDEGGRRTFITMGDNNNVEDKPVNQSQLEGKLVFIAHELGWIPIAVRNLIFRGD